MARFPELIAVVLATALFCSHAAAEGDGYLFSIPAARLAVDAGPLGDHVQAVLHVPDSVRAARLILDVDALELVPASGDRVGVRFGKNSTIGAGPDAAHLADSFVIDYQEPAVRALAGQVRERLGDEPGIPALTQFVHEHIADKTYVHDFHLASRVAANGAGDCTEHAVLVTALARAAGRPARVVLGVILLETTAGVGAFGHAWSEIHDGTAWQIADATLPGEDSTLRSGPYYLPLLALEDEGPGYGLDMMRIAQIQPSRISEIADVAP